VKVTEAPAQLTTRGAKAFGGMYQAGTGMDPVSLAVALTADARLPALPDLGSAPTPSASPRPEKTEADTSAAPVASTTDDGDFPALPVSLAAGALLLAAAALVAVALRRRRARPAASPGTPADPAP
jgi:hypothetical protein